MNVHDHRVLKEPGEAPLSPAAEPKGEDAAARERAQGGAQRSRAGGLFVTGLRVLAKLVLPLLVIAAGFAGYQYFLATKPEPPRKPKAERAFNVRTALIDLVDVRPTITLYGNTVAGREVDIRALVGGRVVETSPDLREGGLAEAGAVLLKIDPLDYETELKQTKAQLDEARSKISEFKASINIAESSLAYARQQVDLAERDLARAEPLVARGATSEKTLDDRKQVLLQRKQAADQLQNEVAVWNARVAQQEAVAARLEAQLDRARQRLAETELTAPFAAYVSDVAAQVGRMVSVNDKVATLIDRDRVDVRFTLTDEQYGRIVSADGDLVGREVKVSWALGQTTFDYMAQVERVGARISAASGGVEVFARVKTPREPQDLRPGAFVTVEVPDAKFENVLVLPSTALYEGDKVYVVEEDRLKGRAVEVVGAKGKRLLVRGAFENGERVLTSRVSTPGDGVLVKEVETE